MSNTKSMYKKLSISTRGTTFEVSQSAKNLSESLDQEIEYYHRQNKTLAQINISKEKEEV